MLIAPATPVVAIAVEESCTRRDIKAARVMTYIRFMDIMNVLRRNTISRRWTKKSGPGNVQGGSG